MKRRGPRRLLIALAMLPLLAGAAFASGPASFVCGGDGVRRATCNCPGDRERLPAPAETTPAVSAACCCDHVDAAQTAPATAAVVESRAGRALPEIVATPVSLPALAASSPGPRARPTVGLAQPPPAVPILLAKQSFLV